jgi:riboflavin kinase / FMN adenylyltransferase
MLIDLSNMIEKDLAIGVFDGLHLGHIDILKNLKNNPILMTFHPHPKKNIKLIYSFETRLTLFKNLGIDNIICFNENSDIYNLSAFEFIKDHIINLNVTNIYISSDFKLGKHRATDAFAFKNLANDFNINVNIIEPYIYNNKKLSSSDIRELIVNGNIKEVNKLLSYKYFIKGIVKEGTKTAEKLGYKTANICDSEGIIIPNDGVYASKTIYNNNLYNSITYIGKSPTLLNNPKVLLETHIFDFNKLIYNEELTIIFKDKIRGEIKFNSKDKLLNRIKKDVLIAYYL